MGKYKLPGGVMDTCLPSLSSKTLQRVNVYIVNESQPKCPRDDHVDLCMKQPFNRARMDKNIALMRGREGGREREVWGEGDTGGSSALLKGNQNTHILRTLNTQIYTPT